MDMGIFIRIGIGGAYEGQGIWTGDYKEPRYSMMVEDDYLVIEVEIPGINKEGITVKLVGEDKIFIKAEGDGRKYLLIRQLPVSVTVENSQAVYRNGLLIIRLPIKGTRIGVE